MSATEINPIEEQTTGAAVDVHRSLGPGLLDLALSGWGAARLINCNDTVLKAGTHRQIR